jgi:hypothetical protein
MTADRYPVGQTWRCACRDRVHASGVAICFGCGQLRPAGIGRQGHQEAPPTQKDGGDPLQTHPPLPQKRIEVAIPRARGPKLTKTEQRYYDDFIKPDFGPGWRIPVALPQGLRVWLANGARYTADWFYVSLHPVDAGQWELVAVEVKGGHRHPSHYTSLHSVRQSAIEFPAITWQIATWDGRQWHVETCPSRAQTATPGEMESPNNGVTGVTTAGRNVP